MTYGWDGSGTNQEDEPELISIINSGDSEQLLSQFHASVNILW